MPTETESLNPVVQFAIRGRARAYLEYRRQQYLAETGTKGNAPLGRMIAEIIVQSAEFKEWEAQK